jgi:hypothetical protein
MIVNGERETKPTEQTTLGGLDIGIRITLAQKTETNDSNE